MAADEIKIEWAKDYFGPDAEMAVQNDNVAQLCYYYRWIKESIRAAKRKGIGDPRLPDDKYIMLYEEDVANTLYRTSDLRLYCMQKAAYIMRSKGYINSFKLDKYSWNVKKTWPKGYGYDGRATHHGQWVKLDDLPVSDKGFRQCKDLIRRYNSYSSLYSVSPVDELQKFKNINFKNGHFFPKVEAVPHDKNEDDGFPRPLIIFYIVCALLFMFVAMNAYAY